MPAPQISLIISTYNSPGALEKVLQGLQTQAAQAHEILIADDGSESPTRELIVQWQARIKLRHIWHAHEGFRRTIILNKAIAAATGDYMVLLDGDCVPHRDFLRDHAALAEKNFWVQGRRCFVKEACVPEFIPGRTSVVKWCLQGRIKGWGKAFRFPFPFVRRDQKFPGILGCNMGFWREDLLAVNGFNEDFIGWGGEDSEIGARLYHLGRRRKLIHGWAVLFHLDHPFVSRANYAASRERLAQTIASGLVRCERGLAQYL